MQNSSFQEFLMKYPGPWHISLIFKRVLAREVKSLEYDPHAQYRFHQTFTVIWIIAMIGLPFCGVLYAHNISSLIIQEISLYANFTTDFGAMSSALAAGNFHCNGCNCKNNIDEARF
jgi:hypothetical protein